MTNSDINQGQKTNDLEELLREASAAEFLKVSTATVAGWRSKGVGPRFIRFSSRCVRYRRRDLIAFVEGLISKNAA